MRHRACISFTKVYRDWLLWISNRSATNCTAPKLQSSRPRSLDIHTFSKTPDLLPQQDSSNASIPHSSWLKTYVFLIWKCECLQELQMVRRLNSILPTSLRDPSPHANTSNQTLVSSPFPLLTMLPDANYNYLAGYWRSGKISNPPIMLSPNRSLSFFLCFSWAPLQHLQTALAAVAPNRLSS
jgi:hypothetical protein